jgi:hypothetical protein
MADIQSKNAPFDHVQTSEPFNHRAANHNPPSQKEGQQCDRRFFNCREIQYQIFSYAEIDFFMLDKATAKAFWADQFETDGIASPVLLGSCFDDAEGNMALALHIPEFVDQDIVRVVVYCFQESATYSISNKVDKSGVINCEPITAGLNIACAMESISMGDETFDFELDSSIDRSETKLGIFKGFERLYSGEFADY